MGNLRRSRGYAFEHDLVGRFNFAEDWWARRLGGSSTGLPDIVVTNNRTGTLLVLECKSTYSNEVYIPPDQVERCQTVCDGFGYYTDKHIIFAIKFARHVLKEGGKYKKKRQPKTYYIDVSSELGLYNAIGEYTTFKATYDRKLSWISDKTSSISIRVQNCDYYPEYSMPWDRVSKRVI
jgi:Holliday junction resolvase